MIGAHDTFTYLDTDNVLVNLISRFWRCQVKSVSELYKAGVRVFDIRVINNDENDFEWWYIGHGLAKVKQKFPNLESICLYFKEQYPGSYIRIMLETDADKLSIRNRFEREASEIIEKYSDIIWTIYIKNPWICMYDSKRFKTVNDTCCHLFNWHIDKDLWTNIKNFEFSSGSIKGWAKNHNPSKITKKMKTDPNTLYFMDYVGVYPELN